MATKKNPANEEEILEAKQEEPVKDTETAKLQAEIAALRKQLATATQPAGRTMASDYDRVRRAEEECVAGGVDPWTVEIEVLAPHREKTEDPWYWISVNGMTVQIPANDRYQKMKLPFAGVLVDLLKYEKASLDYQDSLEVFDPETNPHR